MKRFLQSGILLLCMAACLHAQPQFLHVTYAATSDVTSLTVTSTTAGNAQVILIQLGSNTAGSITDNKSQNWAANLIAQNIIYWTPSSQPLYGDAVNAAFVICNGAAGVTTLTLNSGYTDNINVAFYEITGLPTTGCVGAVQQMVGPAAPTQVSVSTTPMALNGVGIVSFTCWGDGLAVTSATPLSNPNDVGGNPMATFTFTGGNTALTFQTDSGSNVCTGTTAPEGWEAMVVTLNNLTVPTPPITPNFFLGSIFSKSQFLVGLFQAPSANNIFLSTVNLCPVFLTGASSCGGGSVVRHRAWVIQ